MKNIKENMIIDEHDLFNFAFYPDAISEDKKHYILNDNGFSEAIEFYKELKNSLTQQVSIEVKKLLAQKIPAYSFANVIELYPLKSPKIKQNGKRLAADSIELKPKITSKSFVDNDKEYLIKILNNGDETKIFVFSTKDEIVRNFDLVVQPEDATYHFKDNSEPFKINKPIEVEKIEIRFIR